MNAETAGGASDNHAPESTTTSTTTDVTHPDASHSEAATGGPQLDASNARVMAILEEDGFSQEEVREVVKPKDQTDAKDETSQSAELPEGEDPAGKAKGAAAKPESEEKAGGKKAGGEEEALTPEQQTTWPPDALGRIHKLASRRDEEKARAEKAEHERDQLRDQLNGAARPVATPTAEDPLADVDSPEAMEAAIAEFRDMRQWAQENPDGVTDHPIGKDAEGKVITKDFSAKDMARILAQSTRVLDEHVPARIAFLGQQHRHEQVAREAMPEMFQEGTEENRLFKSAQKEVPGIMSIPGAANWIRWAIMGRKLDLEKAGKTNANGKEKAKVEDPKVAAFLRKHPPMAPGVPAARVQERAPAETVAKAQERVEAGEGEEAEVDYVGALRNEQSSKKGVLV